MSVTFVQKESKFVAGYDRAVLRNAAGSHEKKIKIDEFKLKLCRHLV
jgi:hypothetical protein